MNPPKVNERWRVALAGLVAALAIPFLIIDSPAPAEGVETNGAAAGEGADVATVPSSTTTTSTATATPAAEVAGVEIVVVEAAVSPDVIRLSDQAATWSIAREQAVTDGLVERSELLPPSNTNLRLLPVVPSVPTEPEPAPEGLEEPVTETPEAPVEDDSSAETIEETPVEDPAEDAESAEPETPAETEPEPSEDPEPAEAPEPADPPVPVDEVEQASSSPTPPAQVNGRVPPPAGGPTAEQWDALRRCESTHSYSAISPSGLYRGAYQFSQQTWDWVAGIHQPHLVGIDPIGADPAWQDIMAYTLYAMRGWDQWPVCGKNLL